MHEVLEWMRVVEDQVLHQQSKHTHTRCSLPQQLPLTASFSYAVVTLRHSLLDLTALSPCGTQQNTSSYRCMRARKIVTRH